MKKLLSIIAISALVVLPSCCCKKKTSSKSSSSSRSYGKKMVKKLACGCPVGKCTCKA